MTVHATVHTGAVESGEDTGADDANLLPFVAVAQDPTGATYHVQASRAVRGSGPVMIGGRDGPSTHGPLGHLNRILAKTSKPQREEVVSVFVYRDDPNGPTDLADSDHSSAREAVKRAQAFIQAIEQGTFKPDRPSRWWGGAS
jgi:hypothetical protein